MVRLVVRLFLMCGIIAALVMLVYVLLLPMGQCDINLCGPLQPRIPPVT